MMRAPLFTLFLLIATTSFGQMAEMITDLNPGAGDGLAEDALVLATLDDAIFILNEDHLLFSDGTPEETKNIYDLSDSQLVLGDVTYDGSLYLSEYIPSDTSRILRVSNTGVIEVLFEAPGVIQLYLEYKDKIYFNRRSNFIEYLYSFDPSTGSVEEIIELRWFMRDGLKDAIVFNDLIYMVIWPSGMSESYLATYDGEGNIEFLYNFYAANFDNASRLTVNMTVADSNLFFWFGDGTNDSVFYVSDGTSTGTQVLNATDFRRFARSRANRTIGTVGNTILFEGITPSNDRQLWSSDGTVAGTFKIEVESGIDITPQFFTAHNGQLAFCGYHGSQPFSAPDISTLQTDGTIDETKVLLGPNDFPGPARSNGYWLNSHNDSLFMVARTKSWPFNNDVFKSDGTAAGTVKVSTIGDQPGNEISYLTSVNRNLYFFGKTDDLGRELYVYVSPAVDQDGDGFTADIDCDDNNSNVNPDQMETPYNGLDDDCDPLTPDDDLDGDGFLLADDCDDTNPDINPDQLEEPYNGLDDDCDPLTLDDDLDEDGFLLADDCDDMNPDINPDQLEEPYNGLDDDCDPLTLDDDLDEDGFLLADDCDDMNPNINPDQLEDPYNGLDDDCDPMTPDDDLDGDGYLLADDCDDTNPNINPDAEDIPNNGIDEDCDGMDLIVSTFELSDTRINIYPNPVIDRIHIDLSNELQFTASLMNINGQIVASYLNQPTLYVNELPSGLYLLEITDSKSGQSVVKRVVIER